MWIVSIQTSKPLAEALSNELEAWVASVSVFEDQSDEALWHVQAITGVEPSYPDLLNLFHLLCDQYQVPLPIMMIEPLPDKDWLAENRRTFQPITAGAFYIYGSHITDTLPSDQICLQIDASTAFGTGNHGTTQGCLEALTILKNEGYTFTNSLDVGTGTGVLAMAMAKLFQASVVATDNDPQAVQKAQENILLNTCVSQIMLYEDAALESKHIIEKKPFDLVTANILANTLIELAPALSCLTAKGSIVVLSGLLENQIGQVISAYSPHGFTLKGKITHANWATLILTAFGVPQ